MWRDKDGNACGAKRWLYVVHGLIQSIVLSYDFIESHEEVWDVAKKVVDSAKSMNYTYFFKKAKAQQAAEEDFRRRRAEENRRIDEAERQARDAQLDAVAGASVTVSAASSVATHSIAPSSATAPSTTPSSTTPASSSAAATAPP